MSARQHEAFIWEARRQLGTLRTRYLPPWVKPTLRQEWFLRQPEREVFYGGAAGGGKSAALLMAALQYADVPGYAALLLRRTYADLALPGALMDMAQEWLAGSTAKWNANDATWRFPSGATLTFGYLEHEEQKRRYASAEFQYIGFDELTHFTETQYTFLFSRLRKPSRTHYALALDGMGLADVPLRMRSASNPGGRGHDWVDRRFVNAKTRTPGRRFVKAQLADNPHLEHSSYIESLGQLTSVELHRLLHGDWTVRESGGLIRGQWFQRVDKVPFQVDRWVRSWDLAGTEEGEASDPDFTVGALYGINYGATADGVPGQANRYVLADLVRGRWGAGTVETVMRQTAETDGMAVDVVIEQEPGASGKLNMHRLTHVVLEGYNARPVVASGDKAVRARVPAAAAEQGRVYIVNRPWTEAWLDEANRFTGSGREHDDQVDAWSAAHNYLASTGGPASVPVGGTMPSVPLQ